MSEAPGHEGPQCFEVFTLFPEAIDTFCRTGLLGKAVDRGHVEVRTTNFREFTTDKHRTVDDAPFGGGAGMVIKPGPVVEALEHVQRERGPMFRVLLTPSAPRFDQRMAEQLAQHDRIALLCGRYEGIDDRVREHFVDACVSIGDFVLNGGEVAALTIIEAVSRLREGVLGNPESAQTESFAEEHGGSYLEHPQYTRPADFRGHAVPKVLLGGNHADIAAWRKVQARTRTFALRPDLRPSRSLPENTELHVAVPASMKPEPAFVDVLRPHGATLVVLGSDAAAVMPWLEATGGRIEVVGFASLKQLRRRLRQRHGRAAWVVGLAREHDEPGNLEISPDHAQLVDTLLESSDGQNPGRPSLVVVAGLSPRKIQPDAVLAPPALDGVSEASRAPTPSSQEPSSNGDEDRTSPRANSGAQTHGQSLASGERIEDSSRPPALTAIERALAGLDLPHHGLATDRRRQS